MNSASPSRAAEPRLHVVLYQPEIPPNTGNIGRLCLAAGARLHLIRPLGFSLDAKQLLRAGLDYWAEVDVRLWDSFADLRADAEAGGAARFFYFTTKASRAHWEAAFQAGDYLVFGPETRGLPESLIFAAPEGFRLRIPMEASARSLNLATAAGIGLYEALRQVSNSG
jgi:tRNA (cytidine/uridine-2'-O-)-methyltransferase